MISRLSIRDLALMDRTSLDLGKGFTVVTGETGAGKSVLLGAFSLLAGNRAGKTIVRKDAEECVVEAELEVGNDKRFIKALEELDLPACDEGLLLIKRTVHVSKAGRITVNGGAATLAQLQKLGELWIDFHGPGEPQKLMRAETQLEMLDLYSAVEVSLNRYREIWKHRQEILKSIQEMSSAEKLSEDEISFLKSQIESLESLDLTDEAIQKLEREHARSSRAQELSQLLSQMDAALGSEGIAQDLPKILKVAQSIARIDADADSLAKRLEGLVAEADDIRADFERLGRGLSADE